jgi:hypothetical protein
MILLKRCVARNRLSGNRGKRRLRFRLPERAGGVNSSKVKADATVAGRRTFVEDFTREHSLPGLHTTSIEITGIF